jgi:SRSO17 transposase
MRGYQRQQARVPTALPLRTEPEIALMRRAQAQAGRVPHRCVVAEAAYGDNPNALAGLEARQEHSIVGGRTDFQVSLGRAVTSPVWRADALLQTAPRWQRRTMRWRRGTNGWRRKPFAPLRCWRVTSDGQRYEA